MAIWRQSGPNDGGLNHTLDFMLRINALLRDKKEIQPSRAGCYAELRQGTQDVGHHL